MESNNHKGDIKMTTTMQKWGNSLGVRIPQAIAKKYGVHDGSEIEVRTSDQGIVLKPAEKNPTLDELLAGITEENKHEEYFSKPMGRELL